MRQPSILDVVHAVKSAAARHPEVSGWWYLPVRLLRLQGERPASEDRVPQLEVVIEHGPATPDHDAIAREIAALLRDASVKVRSHRGVAEEHRLFRLASRRPKEQTECRT
jgi:hypothetical protein